MQGMNGARLHSLTVFFDFRSANQVLSYGINYIFKSMSLLVRRHILLGNWWEISKNSFFFITSHFFPGNQSPSSSKNLISLLSFVGATIACVLLLGIVVYMQVCNASYMQDAGIQKWHRIHKLVFMQVCYASKSRINRMA